MQHSAGLGWGGLCVATAAHCGHSFTSGLALAFFRKTSQNLVASVGLIPKEIGDVRTHRRSDHD